MDNKRKKIAFAALCMGFFMIILDVTIVNVALPTIASYFNTHLSKLQWVVAGYALTFASLLLLVGSLCDYFSAKNIFQIGLLAFILTSLACALAPSITLLIAFRLMQGAAGAILLPSSLTLISNLYQEPEKRASAIGIWAALGGVACASGPFLGGLLTSIFSWRAIFFINIYCGIISFLLTLFYADAAKPKLIEKLNFDFFGQFVGFVTIFLLAYGLIEASMYGWADPKIIFCLVVCAISFVAFLWVETKVAYPILPLSIFRNRITSMALITAIILNLVFYGELFLIPFYFENIRHYPVFITGLAILPLPGLAVCGSYLGGKLTAKSGAAIVIFIGLFISSLGFYALLALQRTTPAYPWIMVTFLVIGFGVSLATPAMTFAVLNSVEQRRAGVVSGVLNMGNQVGGLVGVAVFGTITAISKNFISGMHKTLLLGGTLFLLAAILSLFLMREKKAS